jgi:hypothetical protein
MLENKKLMSFKLMAGNRLREGREAEQRSFTLH